MRRKGKMGNRGGCTLPPCPKRSECKGMKIWENAEGRRLRSRGAAAILAGYLQTEGRAASLKFSSFRHHVCRNSHHFEG